MLGGDEEAPVHERGVQLSGAIIDGMLDLFGAELPHGAAIHHCACTGLLILEDAQIQGSLSLTGSVVAGIHGDRVVVIGNVNLNEGFKAAGELKFDLAQIGGNLNCNAGEFGPHDGAAITLNGAKISGDFFALGLRAFGEVRLLGAQFSGNFACHGAQLDAGVGKALSADRCVIKGSIFLSHGFRARGIIRLNAAQTEGSVYCEGASFEGGCEGALDADRLVVKGDLRLSAGFKAVGEVFLLGARIGGNLNCSGGSFTATHGNALSADGIVVMRAVFFREGFEAHGTVRLIGAKIGGGFSCRGGLLKAASGDTLLLDGAEVGGTLHFCNLRAPAQRVSLDSATVGALLDDAAAWGDQLRLNGFVYRGFAAGAFTETPARLQWLDRQQDFRPQPWLQLQKVLRESGRFEDARQVAIAFENRLRKQNLIGIAPAGSNAGLAWCYRIAARVFHWAFGVLTGYGYRPMRLLFWVGCAWLLCGAACWFVALPPRGVFAPSDPLVFQHPDYAVCNPANSEPPAADVRGAGNWYLCEKLREEYPPASE